MNGVQTRFKCKLDVKRCKRFVFPPSSLLPRSNALKTKAIRYFQTDRTLTRIVSPPLDGKAQLYGTGTNLDQLVTAGAELTYNVPHWKFGLEYTLSSAWYGSLNTSSGKIKDTHAVCNNRIVAVAMFMF